MISNGSLSAFSATAAANRSAGSRSAGSPPGVARVRTTTPEKGMQQNAAPAPAPPQSGKILPRGSLLNNSV
jgi:hypothetical protein